jgi:hypothetical protein
LIGRVVFSIRLLSLPPFCLPVLIDRSYLKVGIVELCIRETVSESVTRRDVELLVVSIVKVNACISQGFHISALTSKAMTSGVYPRRNQPEAEDPGRY